MYVETILESFVAHQRFWAGPYTLLRVARIQVTRQSMSTIWTQHTLSFAGI